MCVGIFTLIPSLMDSLFQDIDQITEMCFVKLTDTTNSNISSNTTYFYPNSGILVFSANFTTYSNGSFEQLLSGFQQNWKLEENFHHLFKQNEFLLINGNSTIQQGIVLDLALSLNLFIFLIFTLFCFWVSFSLWNSFLLTFEVFLCDNFLRMFFTIV